MEVKHNVVGWFEIPVTDMDRAVSFYETVFDFTLTRAKVGPVDMAWFPCVADSIGSAGSLVSTAGQYKPSSDGVLVYFTAFSGDVSKELARAVVAGGSVLMPKMLITKEIGYMAIFLDSEGNRIALHTH
ncbi:MAG: VOC family protein [Bacteroidota bacterium]